MYINPYRKSVSPWPRPLPLPICDPDFQPVTVEVSCAWLSYIVGALSMLTEQATWDTTDGDEMLLAIERATNLIAIFTAAGNDTPCDNPPIPVACDYHFELGLEGWIVAPAYGVGDYDPSCCFIGTYNGPTDQNQVIIQRDFSEPFVMERFEVFYNGGAGGAGADNVINLFYVTTGGLVNFGTGHVEAGPGHSLAATIHIEGVTALYVEMNAGTSTGPIEITRITVDGVGPATFNC